MESDPSNPTPPKVDEVIAWYQQLQASVNKFIEENPDFSELPPEVRNIFERTAHKLQELKSRPTAPQRHPHSCHFPLNGPAIADLDPWFKEIFEANTNPARIAEILASRIGPVTGRGFNALRDRILAATPVDISVLGGTPFLALESPPTNVHFGQHKRDRSWGFTAPTSRDTITNQLKIFGLEGWDELHNFYTAFDGLYDFVDQRWVCSVQNLRIPRDCEEVIGLYHWQDFAANSPALPRGRATAAQWLVLWEAGWDKLVTNTNRQLALIFYGDLFLLDISLDEFLYRYTHSDPADGEEFLADLSASPS